MIEKKYHSTKQDFKTGFFYKISLSFGILLLLISFFFSVLLIILNEKSTGFLKQLYNISNSSVIEPILALSLLFIAFGIIIYFLHRQFLKLDEIAKDIERLDETEKK